MIDVGANLYNALPQTFGVGNRTVGSTYSLNQPAENQSAGNSLRAITEQFRDNSGIPDFGEKPKEEQGFLSLGPVLDSLRPPPPPVSSPITNEPATWEKLLEEQKRISEARAEQFKQTQEFIDSSPTGVDVAELAQTSSERVLLQIDSNENPIPEDDNGAEEAAAAQAALNNQRSAVEEDPPEIAESETEAEPVETAPLPGQGDRIDSPNQAEPAFSLPDTSPQPEEDQSRTEQQRVEESFSTSPAENNSGTTINLFA